MPNADLTYVADRSNAPYGSKSLDEVRDLTLNSAQVLVNRGATTLVVACNTASAAALEVLRSRFPGIPIVGMEPAVKPAAITSASGVIGVFATAATFQSELFDSVVSAHASSVRVVNAVCPQWVETVERGETGGENVTALVQTAVEPVLAEGADTLVLGCTHFSFLRPTIEGVAGPDIRVIDPAPAIATQTSRIAVEKGAGALEFVASGSVKEFEHLVDTLTELERLRPALPFTS